MVVVEVFRLLFEVIKKIPIFTKGRLNYWQSTFVCKIRMDCPCCNRKIAKIFGENYAGPATMTMINALSVPRRELTHLPMYRTQALPHHSRGNTRDRNHRRRRAASLPKPHKQAFGGMHTRCEWDYGQANSPVHNPFWSPNMPEKSHDF